MAEWWGLPPYEREMLVEGLRAEFGQQQWNETVEDAMAQVAPEFAQAGPPSMGPASEVREASLESIAEMGITVREVH